MFLRRIVVAACRAIVRKYGRMLAGLAFYFSNDPIVTFGA
jgi:hypothetical protein